MVQEALSMRGGASHIQEEMREVEEELEEDSSRHDTQNSRGNPIPLEQLEEGKFESQGHSNSHGSPTSARYGRSGSPRPSRGPSINFPLSGGGGVGPTSRKDKKQWAQGVKEGVRNSLQLMTNPVFAQAFILTFLGEWGDRSQITTIAMGGAHVSFPSLVCSDKADRSRAYPSLHSERY
jgi:putative Ca2+/H+ antiporter (TMEM165/GDT1 family)